MAISQPTSGAGYDDVQVNDLDGDGNLDLVFRKITHGNPGRLQAAWRLSNGDGAFGAEQVFDRTSFNPQGYFDIDGDGDLDVFGSEQGSVWFENTIDVDGSIQRKANQISQRLVDLTGDFNNDGLVDFVVSEYDTQNDIYTFRLLRNAGGAFQSDPMGVVESDDWLESIRTIDIDSDGDRDLLVFFDTAAVLIRNDGEPLAEGNETLSTAFATPEVLDWNPSELPIFDFPDVSSWAVSDVDEDGDLATDSIVTLVGLEAADDEDVIATAEEAIDDAVEDLSRKAKRDDVPVEDAARSALRRVLRKETGKRPRITVHVARV